MNKENMFNKALKDAEKEMKKIRLFLHDFTFPDSCENLKFTEKGISLKLQNEDFLIPWLLVKGFTMFSDKCDNCKKEISEDERHPIVYNYCEKCGKEVLELMENNLNV